MKAGYVYILTNKRFGALYIGVASDLAKRMREHKEMRVEGFSKRNKLDKLVYYEMHTDIALALLREKQLKEADRNSTIRQISEKNPEWNDLHDEITG